MINCIQYKSPQPSLNWTLVLPLAPIRQIIPRRCQPTDTRMSRSSRRNPPEPQSPPKSQRRSSRITEIVNNASEGRSGALGTAWEGKSSAAAVPSKPRRSRSTDARASLCIPHKSQRCSARNTEIVNHASECKSGASGTATTCISSAATEQRKPRRCRSADTRASGSRRNSLEVQPPPKPQIRSSRRTFVNSPSEGKFAISETAGACKSQANVFKIPSDAGVAARLKRVASGQASSHHTPTRMHRSNRARIHGHGETMHLQSNGVGETVQQQSNGVGISDISVVSVEAVCPKDEVEWFRAHYLVVLLDKKRILLKTEKLHWSADDYRLMMEKVKASIRGKSDDMDINIHAPSSAEFFTSDWLWLSLHHGVINIILDRRIDDWHDNEFGIVWNMHALLRRAALSMCND